MSASARNYVYEVKLKGNNKPEPVISKQRLEQIKKNVAPYVKKNNGAKS